jgi:hypothetical protein
MQRLARHRRISTWLTLYLADKRGGNTATAIYFAPFNSKVNNNAADLHLIWIILL